MHLPDADGRPFPRIPTNPGGESLSTMHAGWPPGSEGLTQDLPSVGASTPLNAAQLFTMLLFGHIFFYDASILASVLSALSPGLLTVVT